MKTEEQILERMKEDMAGLMEKNTPEQFKRTYLNDLKTMIWFLE